MWNVGIIGCGKIAQLRHLPEYAAREDVRIAALFDLDVERASRLADQYSARVCASCQELLSDPSIQAVSVCTANRTHRDITVAALNAGKHVLCEKPMATTLKECEDMAAAAKANGKLLMIGQNQRLAEAHVKARELIRSGAIGKPLTFQTYFQHGGPEKWSVDAGANTWFFDKNRAVIGVLADLGIHKIDLIHYLLDQKTVEVMAQLATLDKKTGDGNPITVDDNALCILRMSNGVLGTMIASWTNYGEENNATVLNGTEGTLKLYTDPTHPIILEHHGRIDYYEAGQIQTNERQNKSGVIDRFVDCLNDPAKESISGESVLCAMRAVFACITSSETKQAVKVSM